ncbi:MAG: hypothetical protein ACYCYO_04230 [Bacilli bacterium]
MKENSPKILAEVLEPHIVHQGDTGAAIRVRGFGHRWLPDQMHLPGHHNLAWELNDDERFDPSAGNIQAFREELANVFQPRVILSSEDFEYLYCREDRLGLLKSLADSLGRDDYAVVCFRDWAGYANSLYAELTKHGLTKSAESFRQRHCCEWRICIQRALAILL